MRAEPAGNSRKGATFVVRFVLWLAAALAVAEFATPSAEASRLAREGLLKLETGCTAGDPRRPICIPDTALAAVDDETDAASPGTAGPGQAIDGDDGGFAQSLPPIGGSTASAGVQAAQCAEAQPFPAFHSRAPPFRG